MAKRSNTPRHRSNLPRRTPLAADEKFQALPEKTRKALLSQAGNLKDLTARVHRAYDYLLEKGKVAAPVTNGTPSPQVSVESPTGEDLSAIIEKLDSVQSYVTVCQLALNEQSTDADHRVAYLLLKASDVLCVATEALRGNEEAIAGVRS